MIFTYQRIIRVQDTDATGVIYFANIHQIALEAFEEYLRVKNFSLNQMIQEKNLLLPIVHSEADFFHPIRVGEELHVHLQFTRIGTTSFTHSAEFVNASGQKVATASIVHVVYSLSQNTAQPIPDQLKYLFVS